MSNRLWTMSGTVIVDWEGVAEEIPTPTSNLPLFQSFGSLKKNPASDHAHPLAFGTCACKVRYLEIQYPFPAAQLHLLKGMGRKWFYLPRAIQQSHRSNVWRGLNTS